MPKIPQVIAQQASFGRPANRLDFGAGQAEATRELAGSVAGVGDLAAGLFEAEMTSRVSGALANATSSLNNLRLEVDASPDHNGRTKKFAAGSQKIANEFRESLTYPKFQGLFDERFAGTLERGRMGVAQGVRTAQIDASQANRALAIEQYMDAGEFAEANREVTEGKATGIFDAKAAARWTIAIDNREQAAEKELREASIKDEAMGIVDELMSESLTLPEMQQAVIGIQNREVRDEAWRRLVFRHAAREKNEVTAESEKFRHDYYRITEGEYKDLETLSDHLKASEYSPDQAEYLLKVAKAQGDGLTLSSTASTVNDLREKIVNREIIYTSDLLPHLAGIGDKFTELDTLVTKMRGKEDRELEEASKAFLMMARATLVKSTLNFADAAGEESFFAFQDWFNGEREKRLSEITDHAARLTVVREMVNPSNQSLESGSDYAGNHIRRFHKSLGEQVDAINSSLALQQQYARAVPTQPAAAVVAEDEAGTPVISVPTPDGNEVQMPITQRLPGESIEEYDLRISLGIGANE